MILYRVMRARTKTKQNKRKIAQQTSRRLKPAPEKLQAILDLVNMVSTDAELADVHQLWRELHDWAVAEHQKWYETKRQELDQAKQAIGSPNESVEFLDRLMEHSQRLLDFSGEHMERIDALTQVDPRAVEALNQCLSGLGQSFRDYVWQVDEQTSESKIDVWMAMARYTFVRESREKLRLISRLANVENSQGGFFLAAQLTSSDEI